MEYRISLSTISAWGLKSRAQIYSPLKRAVLSRLITCGAQGDRSRCEACSGGGLRGRRCKPNRDARKPVRSFEACPLEGLRGRRCKPNGEARKPVRSFEACLLGGLRGHRCNLNGDARKPVRSFEAGRKWFWGELPGILLQYPIIRL